MPLRLSRGMDIYIFIHHNMIERTEQKVQQKSTHKKEKNNNNETIYANLHITFSHDRYFATNFLLRFSTTVLGRSNSNCARQ